jgi:hypothetical protein
MVCRLGWNPAQAGSPGSPEAKFFKLLPLHGGKLAEMRRLAHEAIL